MVVYIHSKDEFSKVVHTPENRTGYILKFVSYGCIGYKIVNACIHDIYHNKRIYHIDIDEVPELANAYNVTKVPTVLDITNNNAIENTYTNIYDMLKLNSVN